MSNLVCKTANITTLSLPNTLTSVGVGAFYELDIERVNYRGTYSDYSKVNVSQDNYSNDNLDYGGYRYA